MRSKKIALNSLFISLGIAIYVLESFVPFPFPNGKWGFSNFVVLLSIVLFGAKDGLIVAIGKSFVGSLVTGHFLDVAFFMSVFGSISAAFIESAAFKVRIFGLIGVSILGSVTNNVVQTLVGSVFVGSKALFWILPYMIILGLPGAFANAYIAGKVIPRVQKNYIGIFISTQTEDSKDTVRKL
ncbi:Gx transporter family protein [Thermotoga profunda]|uniref:Gx transporter family protein n=1 Tax=Thermotoga profunda TaxID=1508420 RepID=UPI000A79F98F|nr:Gx transporter family protein [Thermotoga profunda]